MGPGYFGAVDFSGATCLGVSENTIPLLPAPTSAIKPVADDEAHYYDSSASAQLFQFRGRVGSAASGSKSASGSGSKSASGSGSKSASGSGSASVSVSVEKESGSNSVSGTGSNSGSKSGSKSASGSAS